MPGDDVWTHLIDGLLQSSAGPFVIALLVALIALVAAFTYVIVSDQPHKRDVRKKELELQSQREQRKAEEIKARERDAVRQANQRAKEIAINERIAASMDNLTVQTAALTARLEESATHSKKMGETTEDTKEIAKDTNGKVTDMLPKLDEVHEFLLRSRD